MEKNHTHKSHLPLTRCPHCRIAKPHLVRSGQGLVSAAPGKVQRWWYMYACTACGGVVTAASDVSEAGRIIEYYPQMAALSETIPPRAREYLSQARDSLSQPAGAIMLCASAVDAMLKDKGYRDGDLYKRTNQAATDHLITEDIAKWAHQVRLDANDQRHSDESAPLPTETDAERSIGFTSALAEVLYVIPARVTRGIEESKPK